MLTFGSKSFLRVSYAILGNWRTKILKDLSVRQNIGHTACKLVTCIHIIYIKIKIKMMILLSFFSLNLYPNIWGKRVFWGQFLKMFLKKFLSTIWIAPKVSYKKKKRVVGITNVEKSNNSWPKLWMCLSSVVFPHDMTLQSWLW